MAKSHLLILCALFCFLGISSAVVFEVGARKVECFFEELSIGAKVRTNYFVSHGGNQDIDFEILSPGGRVIHTSTREKEGNFFFSVDKPGKHSFCFSNRMSTITSKKINFSLNVNAASDENEEKGQGLDELSTLKYSILQLSEGISSIQAEEKYLRIRERTHRDTTESTNARVLFWSLIETVSLICVSLWQIIYLRRFFEVKRVV